ncbi:MAG: M3 family oligoendopeptidase [Pleurocapsa minor GSE-CHR-MK-17-07R]|jgi:oligoendopeptidase F|nr:M3 family oligoendopeptidase [Pleurocapsa minor GSE-CHR-MK 17-07R]
MFDTLPKTYEPAMTWSWDTYKPYFDALQSAELTADNVVEWLNNWSKVTELAWENYSRKYVAVTIDTTDEARTARLNDFLENVMPPLMIASQALKEKLLASGLEPDGYEVQLRNMRVEAEIFREENVLLQTEEEKMGQEYDRIVGAQSVQWNGEERTLTAMIPERMNLDRAVREQAWRAVIDRGLQDRAALNDLWTRMLKLRLQIAENAGMDYRSYMWKTRKRFDYTPEDCLSFHKAIEETVVPAAARIYERRRAQLGVDSLRPWDSDHQIHVDPLNRPALKPFSDGDALSRATSELFHKVDPALGNYYDIMMEENLLDLENRKGKAPGGYCTAFPYTQRPFIFMNAVGLHDDVQTLLHEGGHAFHVFATDENLPSYLREQPPIEFCEVASMSMELLAAPYFSKAKGGVYSEADAARARIDHLEGMITFWPYMAVVDAFQHWVYTNTDAALNPDNCDAEWARQWDRFMVGIDYTGLEDARVTGWHRKLHIFQIPFYYVEYGIAQLGAAQVWGNSLTDQAGAVAAYRNALALGGTRPLPELFSTAGAKLALDSQTLGAAVALIEKEIHALEN